MRDSFDFQTYWHIVGRLARERRCLRFCDFDHEDPKEPYFILRHDVDYSPQAALILAEQEEARSIRATYFLLAGTRYYNLMAPEHSHVAKRLTDLGHEVGLHYDVNSFRPFPRPEWPRLLKAQATLLGELAAAPVRSIAMHQPALNGDDPFRGQALGFVNAYDDRFIRDSTYVSDSARAWRDSTWTMLKTGEFPERLQLSLHPINWAESDRERTAIFRSVHADLIKDSESAGEELLARIARHSGVIEHDERTSRGEA